MNAVLVVIDSLRRDHLGCYGSAAASARLAAPIRTPHLDALAARGARFENAVLGSFPCLPARHELVDRWLGRFLETFARLGLFEDTLLVVTTDHGFFLGEHGLVGKPDGVPLYREMSHIPLLVCHPDAQAGLRVAEPVQWVDVLPTVLDALGPPPPEPQAQAWTEGLAAEAGTLHGSSLLPLLRGGARARLRLHVRPVPGLPGARRGGPGAPRRREQPHTPGAPRRSRPALRRLPGQRRPSPLAC